MTKRLKLGRYPILSQEIVNDNGILPDFLMRVKSDMKLDDIQFSAEKLRRVTERMKGKMTCDHDGYSPYFFHIVLHWFFRITFYF